MGCYFLLYITMKSQNNVLAQFWGLHFNFFILHLEWRFNEKEEKDGKILHKWDYTEY